MTIPKETQLAVLLRETQWAVADAAYQLPQGRYAPTRCVDLAGVLEQMAVALREYAAPSTAQAPLPESPTI